MYVRLWLMWKAPAFLQWFKVSLASSFPQNHDSAFPIRLRLPNLLSKHFKWFPSRFIRVVHEKMIKNFNPYFLSNRTFSSCIAIGVN
jgi:hypothetical protein